MEDAPVTAATGALGPVIAKLSALVGSEYKLRWRTRRDVKFIRSELKPVHSILWNIWETEELDEASKALKMEALDLADELDDAIFDFILSMERSRNNKRLVQTKIKASPFQDFKKRASDVSGRCRSKWKEKEKVNKKHVATAESCLGKPRAYPFVHKDASELVGMVGPRDKLIQHLVGEGEETPVELQLKMAIIYGMAGMGKTTLVDLVYEAIGNKFQSRAFVSVSPGGNMREVLTKILEQVAVNTGVPVAGTEEATEEEHLIDTICNFLMDKRYLIIIDDMWNWTEREAILMAFPQNELGSRIVVTTRMNIYVEKWRYDSYDHDELLLDMFPEYDSEEGWVYKIDANNIAKRMVAMKPDLVADGFNDEHPIVRICGGMPLAVSCMLSAVAQEREKQAQQGLHAKACDLQDEIEKHVKENGIQNTPGFEPLVESLQLGFDDLPHHMIKTCLLYCGIYPEGHTFKRLDLVRRWISEGLVYKEEDANGYFKDLVNKRFILNASEDGHLGMHPMMVNFLRGKSSQENLITCSSEITPSYNNTSRIRRLCIDNSPCRPREAAAMDPLSGLDWYRLRSVVVFGGIKRVPFETLEGVRVLDLCSIMGVQDDDFKHICGLVRLRHLLGLNGISEIPPEIVRLQCLETFQARNTTLAGFIGNLQELKTLEMVGGLITELPREIGALQKLETLRISNTVIAELPREVWSMQHLKTLDMSHTPIRVLPKEIGELQQLKTLDISGTPITVLPKEIGELEHLEKLLMKGTKVAKIPREIGAQKKLKSLRLNYSVAAVPLEVCSLMVKLPECIQQALKKRDLLSDLSGEMLSFRHPNFGWFGQEGGLIVGAKQMLIPPWVREHFNDLQVLDIRVCKLEEQGLTILREMPTLHDLKLRFEVVPREPAVISGEGFATLYSLTIDSRVPRVTFQQGAMPKLEILKFQFQFYAGPPNRGPVGINHLRKLRFVEFACNEDWYGGPDSPCIRQTIDVMRKEAQELPSSLVYFKVSGHLVKIEQNREMEEAERSSAVGEIEEKIQA